MPLSAPPPSASADAPDRDDAPPPSKTARKKHMHALQALGARIVALAPEQTATLALPERLIDAVAQARTIRAHEGLRRQMQYIGRLMRDVDAAAIEAALDAMQHGHRAEVARHHAAERWRDRLLADESSLGELLAAHGGADAQRVRQLRRQAVREPDNPRFRRELYRALLEALS